MEDRELTYYDAHIKAHQRHMLISWLEDTKNEKMKKLKEEKTNLPPSNVEVPNPPISDRSIKFEQTYEKFTISTPEDISVEQGKIDYVPSIDSDFSNGVFNLNAKIPESANNLEVNIDKNLFDRIVNDNITVPDKMQHVNLGISSEFLSNVQLEKFDISSDVPVLQAAADKDVFKDIFENNVDVPDESFNFDRNVYVRKLSDIHTTNIKSPEYAFKYNVSIKDEKFDNIFTDRINVELNTPELKISIESENTDTLNTKIISLPENFNGIDNNIDLTVFDEINTDALSVNTENTNIVDNSSISDVFKTMNFGLLSVAPENTEVTLNCTVPKFEENNKSEIVLPDTVDNIQLKPDINITIDKVNVPQKTEIPTGNIVMPDIDFAVGMPSVSDLKLAFDSSAVDEIKVKKLPDVVSPDTVERTEAAISTDVFFTNVFSNMRYVTVNNVQSKTEINIEPLTFQNVNVPYGESVKINLPIIETPENIYKIMTAIPDNFDIMNIALNEGKQLNNL